MGKISLQDIAGRLTERRQLSKKQASQFVNEMFYLIQKSLDQEKIVKVKGLGTFRIIDVEDRESVNVNTGDRVLIEGHGKITFTPDALMKELVNKPFSQFETVVLNEGVDFEEPQDIEAPADEPTAEELAEEPTASPTVLPAPEEVAEEPVVVAPVVEEIVVAPVAEEPVVVAPVAKEPVVTAPVAEEPVVADAVVEDTVQEPIEEIAPLVDFVVDSEVPNPVEDANPQVPESAKEETAGIHQEPEPEASGTEQVESETELDNGHRGLKWPLIAAAACLAGFVVGFLVGKEMSVKPWSPDQVAVEKAVQEKPKAVLAEAKKDTVAPAKSVSQDSASKAVRPVAAVQPEEASTKSATEASTKSVEAPAAQPESPDKYEQMDVRIRTGAYRIVGLDHIEKVRSGDNLARICKRTLGPGMECYIEVYNGIKGDSELKKGQEVKIPKLQWKRKKAWKQAEKSL